MTNQSTHMTSDNHSEVMMLDGHRIILNFRTTETEQQCGECKDIMETIKLILTSQRI